MTEKAESLLKLLKELISNEIEREKSLKDEDIFEIVTALSVQNIAFCVLMLPPENRNTYLNDVITNSLKAAEYVDKQHEEK